MTDAKIVAIGLLTQQDVARLGRTFNRLWPVDDADCFDKLLEAIDAAEVELRGGEGAPPGP